MPRDKRFVAEHRGGPLGKQEHRLLALWSVACVEHMLPHVPQADDPRITEALRLARAWAAGEIPTGQAMKGAVAAHAAAREASDGAVTAIARAAGHAVATAHMADHSIGGAMYSLKAADLIGVDRAKEREWQDAALPESVRELVLSARASRKGWE